MKYIRTKDGRIVDISNIRMSYNIKENDISKTKGIIGYYEGIEFIKQADTIEELFDTKVAIRKSNHKAYLGHLSGTFMFQEDSGWLGRLDSYEIIYGAIWTDKGLIYKAKMKGVLPNGEIDWELL